MLSAPPGSLLTRVEGGVMFPALFGWNSAVIVCLTSWPPSWPFGERGREGERRRRGREQRGEREGRGEREREGERRTWLCCFVFIVCVSWHFQLVGFKSPRSGVYEGKNKTETQGPSCVQRSWLICFLSLSRVLCEMYICSRYNVQVVTHCSVGETGRLSAPSSGSAKALFAP